MVLRGKLIEVLVYIPSGISPPLPVGHEADVELPAGAAMYELS